MRKILLLIGLIYFSIAAGLASATETYEIGPAEAGYQVVMGLEKIAIFPFADYSHQSSFHGALTWGGNKRIVRAIQKHFENRGMAVVSPDDTERVLLSEKVIRRFRNTDKPASFAWNIVHSTYSSSMTKEFLKNVLKQQGHTEVLSKDLVIKLGKKLAVDAVVRGIILEKKAYPYIDTRTILEKDLEDPFAGVVPFLIGDTVEQGACYSVANYYKDGLPPAKDIRPVDGQSICALANAPVLVVRIYLQDAKSGAVVWESGFNIRYSLKPAIDERRTFDNVLEQKIDLAMDNLFSRLYHYAGELEAVIYGEGPQGRSVIWRDGVGVVSPPGVGADKGKFDSSLKKKGKEVIDDFASKLYNYKGYWFLIEEKK